MRRPEQTPAPGSFNQLHRGDILNVLLDAPSHKAGRAWLRTTIGRAADRRAEVIGLAETGGAILGRDWHDIPMRRTGEGRYSLALPLLEVGCFYAKAFFMPDGCSVPQWPEGPNTHIKVEPAEYCCDNTIYAAFVRQFGPNRSKQAATNEHIREISTLDELGYTVIPRSGTFRDVIKQLDFIMGKLRFRIIQLLPIHPIPTTYARMGRFGSPFAAMDFAGVDPALAEFDRKTTPLDQFRELADAIHERNGKVFIDIPVNHTGWASYLQIRHPDWFAHNVDRSFQSPGAWGVTWEDLSQLDYRHHALWKHMANVFRLWCKRGVDGFRCDAGYMVPYPAWEYIISKVRAEYPDTLFLLEGLGGKLEVVEDLLSGADLNWAYSEFFQNYDRSQIEAYLPGCINVSATKGALVHFAETHDNNRLAARSQCYAKLRTAMSALFSHQGGFGITNGVEWFATQKIDVHEAMPMSWENSENQVEHIARLNAILEAHPAFHPGAELRLIQRGPGNVLALLRRAAERGSSVLVLANLNDDRPDSAGWHEAEFPVTGQIYDLVSGKQVTIDQSSGTLQYQLSPGEVVCFTADQNDLALVQHASGQSMSLPDRSITQAMQAKALEVYCSFHGNCDFSAVNIQNAVRQLSHDPRAFCLAVASDGHLFNHEENPGPVVHTGPAPVTTWEWPRDTRRIVMVPPGWFLHLKCAHRFNVELCSGDTVLRRENSLPSDDGSNFALILPLEVPSTPLELSLIMTVYKPGTCSRAKATALYLPTWKDAPVETSVNQATLRKNDCYALCTNGRGGMAQVRGAWGEITSQYDAMLAGNLHPDFPVDRHIMLTRCRGWVVNRGYSQAINIDCTENFSIENDGALEWHFAVPVGQGKLVHLDARFRMQNGRNAVSLEIGRKNARPGHDDLNDQTPVVIVLRPDIEDRQNHAKTKAFTGPESSWRHCITSDSNGFVFAPATDRHLHMSVAPGTFNFEPEWVYMVGHPHDADRGFDGTSDLFSPGYFSVELDGGQNSVLQAEIGPIPPLLEAPTGLPPLHIPQQTNGIRLDLAMQNAMRQFVVRRESLQTVIAGYPWFMDWGRDTLICLRGLIAAGLTEECRRIIQQFARFEWRGTIPNMLRGNDASNRETSDATLWLFVACSDLAQAENSPDILNTDAGGRTIRQVLKSIVTHYIAGTPNGIAMDRESGLVFSPSHFTWMDTNFPAGSPREGYPIEIQALWYAALDFMARVDSDERLVKLAAQVQASIRTFFTPVDGGYLSDCLHARRGQSAGSATADDALRPNQLLAITLKAITDRELCARILDACEELLVPGAIRSLADRPVRHPLPVFQGNRLINNPGKPYWGHYQGDEDTHRKPAYHNGTAWTWQFPSYSEALFNTYGANSREAALAILASSTRIINTGCLGQVPEIIDGDDPHILRGCGAQAWGVTELYRVLALLTR